MVKREPLSPEASALITEFKRTGQFDSLRRSLFQEFKESSTHEDLRKAIQNVVDAEVAKDSGLLKRERGKAAALIEGVLSRQSDLYALPNDEYEEGLTSSKQAPFSSRSNWRTSRQKQRRGSLEGDAKRPEGDDTYRKVEEYIENNTVKSPVLWKKVEAQIQERYNETNGNVSGSALPDASSTPSRATTSTQGAYNTPSIDANNYGTPH